MVLILSVIFTAKILMYTSPMTHTKMSSRSQKEPTFWSPLFPLFRAMNSAIGKIKPWYVAFAICLCPITAWVALLFVNQDGWMTDVPSALMWVGLVAWVYWYISVPIVILILFLLTLRQQAAHYAAVAIVFLVSLAVSIIYFTIGSSASHDEFTG